MTKYSVSAFSIAVLALVGGCAAPTKMNAASETGIAAPTVSYLQLDDEHLVRLGGVQSAQFLEESADSGSVYKIELSPMTRAAEPEMIVYSDQAKAFSAWGRIVTALGGRLNHARWTTRTSRAEVAHKSSPATRPSTESVVENDGYSHLTQQLGWLMKCVDVKVLSDAEYQQGRAWAIAELQANPQGAPGVGPRPDFERLYRQLVGLSRSKESGLLNDEEAAKVRAAIVKQAGLVE